METINLKDDLTEAHQLLQPQVNRLKGLIQLWNIFASSKSIADEFHQNYDNLSDTLKMACTKGIVIDYCKPWSDNFSEELNSLKVYETKKKWKFPFLDKSVSSNLHSELEEIRNKMVAHVDKDFEGLGVTLKGATIQNRIEARPRQDGTLEHVFLPAAVTLTSNRGMWWLSDKNKLGEICKHINETKIQVEEEIRESTREFRNLCLDHMHVIDKLTDLMTIEEQPYTNGNVELTSHSKLPKPFYASAPISTKIGDEKIQNLITVYEPSPMYPTGIEILGKGYRLKLGDFSEDGKLEMQVIFPKYPAPKIKIK